MSLNELMHSLDVCVVQGTLTRYRSFVAYLRIIASGIWICILPVCVNVIYTRSDDTPAHWPRRVKTKTIIRLTRLFISTVNFN